MSILVSPPALLTVCPSQTVNGWLFQAARAPTQLQCENILQTKMKPFKPLAFESLMKRDPKQWAHWAQPLGAAIMDQVTSNCAESTMNMIGHAVRRYAGGFLFGFLSRRFLSFTLFLCSGNISLGEVTTRLGAP